MLLSRESSIGEIIRHVCINQEKFTFVFSSLLEKSDYINLLKSLCNSAPPKIFTPTQNYPNEIYFQYSANILLNKENVDEGIDLNSYYIYELKKLGKLWSNELFQILTNPESQATLTRLSFCLNFLMKKRMPLFRSLKYHFWRLLHKFQNLDLIKSFGMTIFEMDDQIDIELLSSFDLIKNINNSNISSFLQIPAVLMTDKSSKLIQSLLSCSEPFPGYSKIFKESNLLTLVNDSIIKRSHFIENILKVGLSYNCNLSKLITLTESCCCQEFLPFYFLLSDGQITEQPIEELSKLDDSHAFYIFKRIYGDRRMTEFFRTNLGAFIPIEKFVNESFVFLMRPVLFENIDIDSIINLSNQYFYTICDKDRDIDFNFYFGLKVISLMLNNNYIFKNKENNNEYFNNYHRIREIKLLLSHIKSKQIIVEIFSTLFVKDKRTNKFVCPFDVAEAVINYISSSFSASEDEADTNENDGEEKNAVHHFKSENEYDRICADIFSRALIHLKLGKLLTITKTRRKKNNELSSPNKNSTTSIEPCLMTPTDIISQLLTRGEFEKASEAANDISNKLPHLGAICEIAKAIQNARTLDFTPILSPESRNIFNIEYCISNNIDSDYVLSNCFKNSNDEIDNDIKSIITKRKEKDLREIFSPIRKLPNLLPSNKLIIKGKLDLEKIEQNLVEIYNDMTEGKQQENCHLAKFLKFIKIFDGKIENFEVEDLVDSIIAKANSWNEIETTLGNNCLIGLLQIIGNLVNKEKFINIVDQKSHIISTSLRSILNIKPESNSDSNKILTNLYLENTKQMEYKYPDLKIKRKEIKTKDIFEIIYNNEESKSQKDNLFNIKINDCEIEEFDRVKSSINSILESKSNENEMISQLIDFRLMNDDLYIFACIDLIMDRLSFHDFLDVFPEFRTVEFESIKSSKSNPSIVLDELIKEERVSTAIDFSSTFNSRELLISKLVKKVEELKRLNEKNVTIFLKKWNELSSEIFERLPKKSFININSQIDLLRNENTAINEKHPELPVLEQYPYLNFDDDLLRIFDSKIEKGMNEDEFYSKYFNCIDDYDDNDDDFEDDSSTYFYHYTSINKNHIFNVIDEYANIYLPHFKQCNIIVQRLGSILFNIVNSIFVKSNKSEQMAIKILEKVLYLLKSIKLSLIKIMNNSLSSTSAESNVKALRRGSITNNNDKDLLITSQSASVQLRRGSITNSNDNELISNISFPFEKEIKLIECLHQFCELTVYNHFNIEYAFLNFQNKHISIKNNLQVPFPLQFFIIVCDQLDYTEMLSKFSDLYGTDITELQLTRIENCYKLCQFSSAIKMIRNLGQKSSSNHSISNELKEKLSLRLQKAIFFDVGDAVFHERIEKIKSYNREEDIDIKLENEEYLCLKNNYKKIRELMVNVEKSNKNHKRNLSLNNSNNLLINDNQSLRNSNNLLINDNQSLRNSNNLLINDNQSLRNRNNLLTNDNQSLRGSRSIESIPKNRYQRIKVNILNYEKVVKLEDMININDINNKKTKNNYDNYPFFDEAVLNELVSVFYSPIEKIRFNSINGNFSKAFKIFNELPKSYCVVQVVLIEIFFAALNSNKYDDLFAYLDNVKYIKNSKKVNGEGNHIDFNKLLFNDVSNSLQKMKMNIVLCDFLSRLEQYEGIIAYMIKIIDEDRSWEDFLRHLDIIIDTIQKELNKRTNDGNININRNNGPLYSNNELMTLLSKAGVLNNFTRLCMDQKIAYPSSKTRPNENQSLFKIKNISILKIQNNNAGRASLLSSIEEMAVIALYYEKFNLGLQIIELSRSNNNNNSPRNKIQPIENLNQDSFTIDEASFALFKACDTLVDKMNMTKRPLSAYFEKMYQRLDSNSYAMLSLALSKVVFGKAVSHNDVPLFIERNVHGLKLQANILIELGLLNDALRIALKTNDSRLIKKLEKQASVYGNTNVRAICKRFLEQNV